MRKRTTLTLERLEQREVPVVGALQAPPPVLHGGIFDGIVKLKGPKPQPGEFWTGTGGLIATNAGQGYGHHILTAAHATPLDKLTTVYFELARQGKLVNIPVNVPSGAGYKHEHSLYSQSPSYDAGIQKLVDQVDSAPNRLLVAPFTAQRYTLAPANFDTVAAIGMTIEFAGYGQTGNGTSGEVDGTQGVKRLGKNTIEAYDSNTHEWRYDFDDGTAANNRLNGAGWLGNAAEAMGSHGDSGSPVFVDGQIVGVYSTFLSWNANAVVSFSDVGKPLSVSTIIPHLITPQIDQAGAYHVVLDMQQQIYGASGPLFLGKLDSGILDDLTIMAENVCGMLQIRVVGPDPNLDDIYYSAPASNILSLTLRGSDDNETFRIIGDLGLPGGVAVDGGTGKDSLVVDESLATREDNHYTFGPMASPNSNWTRLYRNDGNKNYPVDSVNIDKYTLLTGSGKDVIRIEKATDLLHGMHIFAGAKKDDIFVGAGAGGLDHVRTVVWVNGELDSANLFYLDNNITDVAGREYVLGKSDVGGWDLRLGIVGNPLAVYSANVVKYTLQASQKVDSVRIDATSKYASEGTFIFGNDATDFITVGSASDGLKHVSGEITIDVGGGYNNRVTVADRNGDQSGTYTFTESKIERTGGPVILFATPADAYLEAAPGTNTIKLKGNPGGAGGKVSIFAGADAGIVTIGEAAGGNGILGAVSVDGEGGNDLIKVFVDLLDPTLSNLERLELVAGALTLNTTSGLFDEVAQIGGTLTGSAVVTASTKLTWSGGVMSGSGTTTSMANATITGGDIALSRMLGLAGDSKWTGKINGSDGTVMNWGTLDALGATTEGHLNNGGGLLKPGSVSQSIGTITVQGNFAHTAGVVQFQVNGGAADHIAVTGTVTLGGAATLVPLAEPYSTRYTLISNDSSFGVTNIFAALPQATLITDLLSRKHSMNYFGGGSQQTSGNDVVLDNFAPDAVNDSLPAVEDENNDLAVLANDTDPEGDTLSITSVGTPGFGTAIILGSVIRYRPMLNYHGSDYFSYTISDGNGGTDTAKVTVTVASVNDRPVPVDDSASTMAGMGTYVLVLGNDTDADGDALAVWSHTTPSSGTLGFSGGTANYTPNPGFSGSDSFTYTIHDGTLESAGSATVTITVVSPPPPPPSPPPPPPPGQGSVSGRVWDDTDGDGVQDANEASFGTSVQVLLLDTNGNTVAETWTTGGLYTFANIDDDEYRIRILLPAGYGFAPPDQGSDGSDSDVDADGYSGFFTVSGFTWLDLDGGLISE